MSTPAFVNPSFVTPVEPAAVWARLDGVPDPEIPVLSVVDLGVVRAVALDAGRVRVTITPTYSGCPAAEVIEREVLAAARELDPYAEVHVALAPPWTTDWISDAGREKLRAYGIAPPPQGATKAALLNTAAAACPRCGSLDTRRISEFGATPCKAMHACKACLEPFEAFKCL